MTLARVAPACSQTRSGLSVTTAGGFSPVMGRGVGVASPDLDGVRIDTATRVPEWPTEVEVIEERRLELHLGDVHRAIDELRAGKDVELEHGLRDPETNLTGDNPHATARIARAHLNEFAGSYTRLDRLEEEAKRDWSARRQQP